VVLHSGRLKERRGRRPGVAGEVKGEGHESCLAGWGGVGGTRTTYAKEKSFEGKEEGQGTKTQTQQTRRCIQGGATDRLKRGTTDIDKVSE